MSTGTALTLRPMRWWDLPAVMAIERETFGDEAWSEAMFWSELAEPATRRYTVLDGAAPGAGSAGIVGYAGLCAYGDEAYVQTIAVTAGERGRGLGTRLLLDLLDEADRRGTRVDLEVRVDNPVAVALYERHGFHRIGLRRGYYQPSGTDALVMRRELDAPQAAAGA